MARWTGTTLSVLAAQTIILAETFDKAKASVSNRQWAKTQAETPVTWESKKDHWRAAKKQLFLTSRLFGEPPNGDP